MQCAAERLSGQRTFDVHWFQRDINGNIINHGRPGLFSDVPESENVIFGEQLLNRPPNNSYIGEYWCQVIDTTTPSAPVYLGVSDSIIIENYASYGNTSACNSVRSINENKCADSTITISSISLTASSLQTNTIYGTTSSTQG